MKYFGHENDFANSNETVGVLLVNLGSPEKPICPRLRDYLSEFLMDPRVIELPRLLRTILVKGIIINVRSHKSAATYRKIWTDEGSPLLRNSDSLGNKVSQLLELNQASYKVRVAMRYGKPNVAEKVKVLQEQGIRKLIVIPMYPQYSGSTNGSVFDALGGAMANQRWVPQLHFISDYYKRKSYIQAVGDSVLQHWRENGRNQKLLMSFHGVPKKYSSSGDPYESQCRATATASCQLSKIG